MPAAISKDQLANITASEFAKLEKLIASVPAEQALSRDEDGISVKDIIAHRAHWIGLFLGWYTDGQAGKPVFFPAKGYKWSELKRYNAELRQQQAGLGWDEACTALQKGHDQLTRFIEAHSDSELYGGPMKGARNDWTTGRWAEAAGASHYRSAAKYIRARLRSLSA